MIERREPAAPPIDPADARLLQTARRIVGSRHDAEDVVQEVWVRYLQADSAGMGDPERWFHRITRNLALSWRRRERTRRQREVAITRPLRDDSSEGELEARALRKLVSERIARLNDPYRATLQEYVLEGRDAGEIARRQGCSRATVRSQIKRGLQRLRERRRPSRRDAVAALLWRWSRAPALARLGFVGAGALLVAGGLLRLGGDVDAGAPRGVSAPTVVSAGPVASDLEDAGARFAARDPVSVPAPPPPAVEESQPAPGDLLRVTGSVVSARDRLPVADYRILWAPLDEPDDGVVAWQPPAGLRVPFEVGVRPGWVWAERDGSFPSNRFLAERFPAHGEIPLVDEHVVAGRLLDASGRPVPQATIRVRTVDAFARASDERSVRLPLARVATTDSSGRFEVARPWMRPVRATVFSGARLIGTAFLPHRKTDIVLRENASVSGWLVDADGRPTAHALVHVRPDLPDAGRGERVEWSERGDANGRFRLEELPPGRIALLFEHAAAETGTVFATLGLDLARGESREIGDVVLDSGRDIAGEVLAEERPREPWIVRARSTPAVRGGGDRRSVRVAADGTFRLPGCWSDAYDLYVHPADDATALPYAFAKDVRPGSRVTLAVGDAGIPSASLRGRLRVPPQLLDGELRLELVGEAIPEPMLLRVAERSFASPSLPPGEYELVALLPGLGGATVARTVLRPGEDLALDVTIPVPGSLAVDLGGPIEAGSTVQYRLRGDHVSVVEWDVEGQRPSVGSIAPELDHERGLLFFPRLLPESYRISVRGPFPTVSAEVQVEEGSCARLATAGDETVSVAIRVSASRTLAAGEELEVRHRHGQRWRPLLFWRDVERTNQGLLTYDRLELPVGVHEFEASTTGGLRGRAHLELAPGMPETPLALELCEGRCR